MITNEELTIGLKTLLTFSNHYAELLNMYDGGERIGFDSVESWINRLQEIGTLPKKDIPDGGGEVDRRRIMTVELWYCSACNISTNNWRNCPRCKQIAIHKKFYLIPVEDHKKT